jgi:amino acid adenylation domain-containing protein
MKDLQTPDTLELSPAKRALLEKQLHRQLKSPGTRPAIPVRDAGAPTPASYGQEQLWFLSQLVPGTTAYNESMAIQCPPNLDVEALQRAFNEVLRRHEAWRTVFREDGGRLLQVVLPPQVHRLRQVDLAGLPADERGVEARRLAEQDARRPFDLGVGPLWRATLFDLGGLGHRLHLTLHHAIFDGVSVDQLLVAELTTLYEAFSQGRTSPLAELPIQYPDYAIWQRNWSEGPEAQAQLDNLREQLRGLPTLQLPTDRPRASMQTFRGGYRPVAVSRQAADGLRRLGREEGASLFMGAVAAFKVALHRYSGQDDLVVGTVSSGRKLPELDGMLGYLQNSVPLRTDLSGDPSFRTLLGRVREVALTALANDDLPFERLVQELQPQRDPSRNPLFDVLFTLQPPVPQLPAGWDVLPNAVDNGAAKLDLSVELIERQGGLAGRLTYNSDLFDGETIERLAGHFQTLLEAAVADPERPISQLPMLTQEETARLDAWNSNQAEIPAVSLDQLVERQAADRPDAVAAEFEGSQLSYRELDERANRLAHRLRDLGAETDRPVAICVERGLEMVVAVLATLKAGAPYLPLDPNHPQDRLALMIEDSQTTIVVTQSDLIPSLPFAGSEQNPAVQTLCLDEEEELLSRLPESRPDGVASPDDLAYVIYTSGSTGRPKGVQVPHSGAVNVVETFASTLDFGPEDVLLAVTTLSFDISVLELFLPLATGGRLLIGGQRAASDPEELAALISRSGATLLQATPSSWRLLIESGWKGAPGLRALSGGEPLPPDLADRLLERCQAVWNGYGPTETTIYSTLAKVERGERITIGRPIPNTRLHVVDRNGSRLPLGVPGELWIGGAGVTRGYLGRSELTAERFIQDPFARGGGDRLYRTGDLVRMLATGEVEHLGRIDQQVKVRGYRIEPGEIEAALLEDPAIRETVVVSHEFSPGDPRLAAYLVSAEGAAPDTDQLRARLRTRLPDYMVPSAFLNLDALPRTPNGKLDRGSLPEPRSSQQPAAGERPRSQVEADLTEIWADVLGLKEVSRQDDFFALGGHSLLAVRLMAEVGRRFDRSVPLSAIFQQGSTIAGLASLLEESEAPAAPASPASPLVVPVRTAGSMATLFVIQPDQNGLLALRHFLNRLDEDQPVTAIVPRTEEGRFDAGRSLDSMAGELLHALRAEQPHGPYRLAGFCLGGLIAYEIACRLRDEGEEVAFLGLLDTMAPDISLRLIEDSGTLRGRLREKLMTDPRRWPAALRARLRRILRLGGGASQETAAVDLEGAASAIKDHRMRSCDAPLTVIGSHWYQRWAREASLGWRRLHAGQIGVEIVPGDHNSVLQEPHVNELAARFTTRLEAVLPDSSRGGAGGPGRPAGTGLSVPGGSLLRPASASEAVASYRVSVVIPARNEAANLPHVLPRIPHWVDELILVDGNSTDDTVRVARELWPGITTIRQNGKGKGDALCQGFEAATGDIVVALDADGSTDPAEIPLFVGALQGGADFVRGSRYIQGGGSADLSLFRSLGNLALTTVVRLLYRNRFSDLCYGYTAFWRRVLPVLQPEAPGFEIEAQLNTRALVRGLKVFEVPSFERVRITGSSSLRAVPDGWRVLKTVLAERLRRDPRRGQPSREVWGPSLPPARPPAALAARTTASAWREEAC